MVVYNYLCYKEASELMEYGGELREMATDLNREFPGTKAAQHAEELRRLVLHFRDEIDRRSEALKDVFKAQEWWQSCDYSRGQVEGAIVQYEAGCK